MGVECRFGTGGLMLGSHCRLNKRTDLHRRVVQWVLLGPASSTYVMRVTIILSGAVEIFLALAVRGCLNFGCRQWESGCCARGLMESNGALHSSSCSDTVYKRR